VVNVIQLVCFALPCLNQGLLYCWTIFLENQSRVVAQLAKVLQRLEDVLLFLLILRLDSFLRLLLLGLGKVVV